MRINSEESFSFLLGKWPQNGEDVVKKISRQEKKEGFPQREAPFSKRMVGKT